MKDTRITVSKKGLLFILVVLVIGFILWFVKKSEASQPIYSCTQAHAEGIYNIKKGNSMYRPSLDRDHDGVACE